MRKGHSERPLARYEAMRDFDLTPEPSGVFKATADGRSFVVQKHAARRLHYDFRLELDGVMKSWAVPKGPSLSPSDKRLAVEVEDHPLDYRDFEGTIPKGQYGGGTVIVWDRGTWEPIGDAHAGLAKGHLEFAIHGEKLEGTYDLVRLAPRGDRARSDKPQWLLIKKKDAHARTGKDADVATRSPKSVLTARSIEEVEHGGDAPAPRFGSLAPELATLVKEVPANDGYLFEIKYDGYRAIATLDEGKVRIASRSGKDWTAKFSSIASALATLRARTAVFDGEVAYVDDEGKTDFQKLQNALGGGVGASRLVYFVFDLLFYDGEDLRSLPLTERKRRLETVLAGEEPPLRYGGHVDHGGKAFLAEACKMGLEGILAKVADAPYREGRGKDWLKIKCLGRQEFAIVGFSAPKGSRTGIGALLLGVRKGRGFRYAGRVGTGFTQRSLAELTKKLKPLIATEPSALGAPRAKDVTWVQPKLVCEVAFTEWTTDGVLRHPTFQGLREDKQASETHVEKPKTRPAPARANGDRVLSVKISHGDRVIDESSGATKADLVRYYADVADRFLAYADRRPLMLVRCTEGTKRAKKKPGSFGASCFVQKHLGRGIGDDIGRTTIEGEEAIYVEKAEELVLLAQFNTVEFHGWGARLVPKLTSWRHPDWLVFDLDPDEGLGFDVVVQAALDVRERLGRLESFVKTTGGKGLHVVVPIQGATWAKARRFAEGFANALAKVSPERYVATMSKRARRGKIFVDWLRNGAGATAVLPYSARARPGLPVAMPVAWSDLASLDPREFTIAAARAWLKKRKRDPWRELLTVKQSLPDL